MFKKIAKVLIMSVTIVGAMTMVEEESNAKVNRTKEGNVVVTEQAQEEQIVSNVGDGQEYAYYVTEIIGNQIFGTPLNKESYTNKGIFLYKEEVSFDVKVGDEIVVMWGNEEDEFILIDRAVKDENGEYISETKNRINQALKELRKASELAKMNK